ncbi:hypothetical protein HYV71_03685 [Candidatus Uhrbacteria bacterium]|nr:hypothetical protein [Candidatus Uhrbacteria bacterium]
MKRIARHIIIGILIFSFLLPAQTTFALTFQPNAILSDEEFFDANSMDADSIQRFLERRESALATYTARDIDGVTKRAADIIWRASKTHGISPKVLLVLLQKEQSLIENKKPSQYSFDWATGYARCDSCSATDPIVAAYKGFVSQIEKAAWRKKYYTLEPQKFRFHPGEMQMVDGYPITPNNWATAVLYNYTPHLRGNFSFWKIWNRYFAKVFPDGMIVKSTSNPDVWLIQNGKRRLFSSIGVFRSRYDEQNIVNVDQTSLDAYDMGAPVKFPQYALLQATNGAVFLHVDDTRYGIASKDIFRKIGFRAEELIQAADADLIDIPLAGYIKAPDDNPMGNLIQHRGTGAVYYVQNGKKRPILEKAVLKANFAHRSITPMEDHELKKLPDGAPVLFDDGTLVTTPATHTVYIISNGQKRPFLSADAFISLGFQWGQIVRSNGRTLDLHEEGNPVDLGTIVDQEYTPPVTTTVLGVRKNATL